MLQDAVDAGAAALKPGAQGWEVDAAAREYLVKAGYPEYQHALGHHLGTGLGEGTARDQGDPVAPVLGARRVHSVRRLPRVERAVSRRLKGRSDCLVLNASDPPAWTMGRDDPVS